MSYDHFRSGNHTTWFTQLPPIPMDLAQFGEFLASPCVTNYVQHILIFLKATEIFSPMQWLLSLYVLAALCPPWFLSAGVEGDLIRLVHAFHTCQMTPTSFKVLHQLLSITSFQNLPPELVYDLGIIQKRIQWSPSEFDRSLLSAVSYFEAMFHRQVQSYGFRAILAVRCQAKPVEPLKLFATLIRGLECLQKCRIRNHADAGDGRSFPCPWEGCRKVDTAHA